MNSSFFLLKLLASVLMLLIMLVVVNEASLLSKLKPKREKCMMYNPSVHGNGNGGSHEGHRVKRLAGGSQGEIQRMPWMVYIQATWLNRGTRNMMLNCTASLISARHVITAAHCLPINFMPNSSYTFTVYYGSSNHSAGRSIVLDRSAAQVHPNYTTFIDYSVGLVISPFDYGILDLGQDLELDDTVHPVCVACLNNETEPMGPAIIAGWGNQNGACTGLDSVYPDIFKYDTVGIHQCLTPIFESIDKVCTQADSNHGIGGTDSGGPVLASFNNGTKFLQVGVNGANNCGTTMRENAFDKIDGKWLKEVTGIKKICKIEMPKSH